MYQQVNAMLFRSKSQQCAICRHMDPYTNGALKGPEQVWWAPFKFFTADWWQHTDIFPKNQTSCAASCRLRQTLIHIKYEQASCFTVSKWSKPAYHSEPLVQQKSVLCLFCAVSLHVGAFNFGAGAQWTALAVHHAAEEVFQYLKLGETVFTWSNRNRKGYKGIFIALML